MRNRLLLLSALMGLGTLGGTSPLRAQANDQIDPASLPAREMHQGVTLAVRPLVTEAAYKAQFTEKTPYEAGILALEVFIRNDNDKPIRLTLDTMRLLVERSGQPRQRIELLTAEDVADRVLLETPTNPKLSRLPVGNRIPDRSRDKNWQEFVARMKAAGLPSESSARKQRCTASSSSTLPATTTGSPTPVWIFPTSPSCRVTKRSSFSRWIWRRRCADCRNDTLTSVCPVSITPLK